MCNLESYLQTSDLPRHYEKLFSHSILEPYRLHTLSYPSKSLFSTDLFQNFGRSNRKTSRLEIRIEFQKL